LTEQDEVGGRKKQDSPRGSSSRHPPWVRCGIGGVLMGLANLVPGVSGGTMILILGLYDEFVSSIADATRLRFSRRSVSFLAVVACCALGTVATLAGPMALLVSSHRVAMYSLFVGMTLGGVPVLWKMLRPLNRRVLIAAAIGLALMVGIAVGSPEKASLTKAEKAAIRAAVEGGEYELKHAYSTDVAAGVLGMSAMVLPGISGAYMLLLLGRYEQILAAISLTKDYAVSMGRAGDPSALHILVPVAIGAMLSLIGVTNALKWFLRHHEKATIGLLLGLLVGSAVMLWLVTDVRGAWAWGEAGACSAAGFGLTLGLSRIGARRSGAVTGQGRACD
jgi:putative membrane protein